MTTDIVRTIAAPTCTCESSAAHFAELRDATGRLPDGFALQFTAGKESILAESELIPGLSPTYRKPVGPGQGTVHRGRVTFVSVGISPSDVRVSIEPNSSANTGTRADGGFSISLCGPNPYGGGRLQPGTYQINARNAGQGSPAFEISAGGKYCWPTSGRGTFTVHDVQWGGDKGNRLLALHVSWDMNTGRGKSRRISGEFAYEAPATAKERVPLATPGDERTIAVC